MSKPCVIVEFQCQAETEAMHAAEWNILPGGALVVKGLEVDALQGDAVVTNVYAPGAWSIARVVSRKDCGVCS